MATTQTTTKPANKPANKGANKPANKGETKAAQSTAPVAKAIVAARIIDKALLAFVKGIAGAYHKGRLTVDADGNVKATKEGAAFFASRLSTSKARETVAKAMADNASLKGGACGSRAWVSNAAIIAGKPVAMPVCAGAGDTEQQAAIAALIVAGK